MSKKRAEPGIIMSRVISFIERQNENCSSILNRILLNFLSFVANAVRLSQLVHNIPWEHFLHTTLPQYLHSNNFLILTGDLKKEEKRRNINIMQKIKIDVVAFIPMNAVPQSLFVEAQSPLFFKKIWFQK